eukprot:CAMPEP_0117504208 /NCGR_PEP_ID=MMETSP0784-20121206/24731_1 /TAXON_ID=39447 /ORGANISM="" /LENGTH=568 /DNA_ID=CAMNT_0005299557 /DNA_START=65 /DNA_END=1771 /DNA_ORIENTATION=-
MVLTDDLGWNTAWNNADIHSPSINGLAADGLKLTSHYTYRFCSPTRAAFLTGRSPYKLLNIRHNILPVYRPESTDLRFTMLPKRLSEAGYRSYQIGKWHQGFASKEMLPVGRGFDESYGYLAGGEDHFTQVTAQCEGWGDRAQGAVTDYWEQGGLAPPTGRAITNCNVPVADRNACPLFTVISHNESSARATELCAKGVFANCAFDDKTKTCFQCKTRRYTGFDFAAKAVDVIKNHRSFYSDRPMFMYLALHDTHAPIEAPDEFKALYNFDLDLRNTFDAMVSVVDSTVANVSAALKTWGMWNQTLFVWTTDNGSPCDVAGSNAPLRGNKGSGWEGGVRVPAFVNGGMLPNAMRGRTLDGIVAIWDFFATFLGLAGVDPVEPNKLSPSPVDSYDMWPYLSGAIDVSPRTEIVFDHLMFNRAEIGACVNAAGRKYGNITQILPCSGTGALRVGDYKLMVGTFGYAGHYGQFSPNASWRPDLVHLTLCSLTEPCLFNVTADIAEVHDLAAERPEIVAELLERFHAYDAEYHPPSEGPDKYLAEFCNAALHNGGFTTYGWGSSQMGQELII